MHIGCSCCTNVPDLADVTDEELVQAMQAMIDEVWYTKGVTPGLINESVTKAFFQRLWSAVTESYGIDITDTDFDTPDYNMLKALRENVWHFSAAKNYQQLRELSGALIGPDGNLATRAMFEASAKKILDITGKTYLRAEYDLAVAGAQAASKWVAIKENRATLGYIEFDAVLDSQTTALCRSLDGIVVPWDHPYVSKYFPPNHFGCRLTTRQRANGPVSANLPYPEIPQMFSNNMAENGLIYPADHPYFIDNPAGVKAAADKLRKAE